MAECVNADDMIWKKNMLIGGDDSMDVWDDRALIKAYDRAVAMVKGEIESEMSEAENNRSLEMKSKKLPKKHKNVSRNWKVGDKCLALFTEDELYYEAEILSIDNKRNLATVQYDYYGNEEIIDIDVLLDIKEKDQLNFVKNDESDLGESIATFSSVERSRHQMPQHHHHFKVSDICYVIDRGGKSRQAVINSIISRNKCLVTFTKTGIQAEVNTKHMRINPPDITNKSKKYKKKLAPHINSHMAPPIHPQPHWPPFFDSNPMQPPGSFSNPFMQGFSGGCSSIPNTMSSSSHKLPPFPPPPTLLPHGNEDEEALANMLMSWYMNGFHTGYYQGLQHARERMKNDELSISSDTEGS